jgi:tetratricopeptide (TPR) repeat protein
LSGYEKDIRSAAAAIESAKNDAQRAEAYSSRGAAYSEKARYSRGMKLIPEEEYKRLFDLAIQDHNHAIALQPENAEMYYQRGRAYYDRGWLDINEKGKATTTYLALAKANFSAAVERNHKNAMAYDMLGLADAGLGDWTQAIADFSQEAALDPRANYRVWDAYCNRGSAYVGEKKFEQAESDLKRAMEMQSSGDPCECEPYNPLLALYLTQTHEYDKARAVVAKAQASKKWIAPEYLEQLRASGR